MPSGGSATLVSWLHASCVLNTVLITASEPLLYFTPPASIQMLLSQRVEEGSEASRGSLIRQCL